MTSQLHKDITKLLKKWQRYKTQHRKKMMHHVRNPQSEANEQVDRMELHNGIEQGVDYCLQDIQALLLKDAASSYDDDHYDAKVIGRKD